MKALSIRQPWAWAILHAGKRIENRDWAGCAFRGPLLLHASKTCTRAEYIDAVEWMHMGGLARLEHHMQFLSAPVVPALDALSRGGIVGVCDLVDIVRGRTGHLEDPWFVGPLGLVLANVRPLPFTPFKGALGFFDVPEDIVGPLLVEAP